MIKNETIQYYVEGECEEKIIGVLKTQLQLIKPGKVQKLNVVQEKISKARLMNLKEKTIVVLVFDTDVTNEKILYSNIDILNKCSRVKKVICIPQVLNFEDEIKRCCSIKNVKELTSSKSTGEFKADFIKMKNLDVKLKQFKFDMSKFWNMECRDGFENIKNESNYIKIK